MIFNYKNDKLQYTLSIKENRDVYYVFIRFNQTDYPLGCEFAVRNNKIMWFEGAFSAIIADDELLLRKIITEDVIKYFDKIMSLNTFW